VGQVVVVGSLNADVVMRVRRFPAPGVTVVADRVERSAGGKGANQAFAAARAGARTRLLGAVGADDDGARQLAALVDAGVDVSGVERQAGRRTGTAVVVVLETGENAILVDAGANGCLDESRIVAALAGPEAGSRSLVLLQSEVGAAVVDAAATAADAGGARVIVNNGPWSSLAPRTLEVADPLVLNEHEAAEACADGGEVGRADLADAVRRTHGCRSVVVTHGAWGVTTIGPEGRGRIAAPVVPRVVDTTGAGDAFVGTLAAALAGGGGLRHAIEAGQRAAAEVVTAYGARAVGRHVPPPRP
jgi:ribokinase